MRRVRSRVTPQTALVAVLALALALVGGIGLGRATAPAAGSAAAVSSGAPAASGSPVASGGIVPSAGSSGGPAYEATASGPLLGRADAKVRLTYWADFQCPFCARFASEMLPQLASRIEDGTVSVLHRDFVFLGAESIDAAIAVRCGGEQGKYWPMHDAVYEMQAGENNGAFTVPHLKFIAAAIGLDAAAFSACMARHDVLVAVLDETAEGERGGITSTPTVDLPGARLRGISDPAALLAAVDAAVASAATPSPAAPAPHPSGDPWAGVASSGRSAGAAAAPVTVELWVDYQAKALPPLIADLEPGLRVRVAAGRARIELHDLATLGDESIIAASFVRCAAQDRESTVWFAHDILGSAAQGPNAGVFSSRGLLFLGAKLGYDVKALDACMADPATAAAISAETTTGTSLGLGSAPAIIVKVGGVEAARFTGTLDAAKVLAAIDAAK